MRRWRVLVVAASVAAVWGAGTLAAAVAPGTAAVAAAGAAVPAAGSWGRAMEMPGLAALSTGSDAAVNSVSCASAGNCAAGGYYSYDRATDAEQGFVAVERHGRWGRAIKVPGLATLNKGGYSRVFSVSCASAGNCAAGGCTGTTATVTGRGSWPSSGTAAGARRSRYPAWAP